MTNEAVLLVSDKLLNLSRDASRVVDPNHPVDYSRKDVPSSYKCSKCDATGCKLWREYQTPLEYQTLLCLECACHDQNKIRTPTEDGCSLYTDTVYYWYRTATTPDGQWCGYDPKEGPPPNATETFNEREKTDQIGWLVPAVPTKENDSYWGYCAVPQEGCDWWSNLPTLRS